MSVKNFVQCGLVTPVATNTTELVLVAPTASYQYPDLAGGTLVIADSVARPTFYEIISYTHRIDNVLYGVVRAKEGTTARAWIGSVWIYQALTAKDYLDALALKANAANAALTGTPTAPTAAPGTNTNQIATMAALQAAIAALIESSPAALNTLNELAAALGDDPNFASTMTTALAGKEPSIAAGTAAQMWLGNKTWATVLSQVQAVLLTGLGAGSNSTILASDTLIAALAKIQNQLNNKAASSDSRLTDAREWTAAEVTQAEAEAGTVTTVRKWSPLRVWQAVLASSLTGINLTLGTAVTAADTVLIAIGKLQKQITDAATNLAGNVRATMLTGYVTGSNVVLNSTDTVLAAFGKLQAQITGMATSKLDATANAVSASKLQTARTIALGGDLTGSVAFDGSDNALLNAALPARLGKTAQIITDWDLAIENGYYQGSDSLNAPSPGWNIGHVISHGGGGWATQDVHAFSGDSPVDSKAFRRERNNGTWGSWYRLRTTEAEQSALYNNASNLSSGIVPDARLSGTYTGVNITGNAATATKLQTARTIGGVSFDGSANISLPGVNVAGTQATTGNAATATALQTARTIGGVSFNGSANINLPGVNTAGNQNTTGNAATATKLATARTINDVAFDGTANITLPNTDGTPAGAVMAFARSTAPAGWLKANGSAISRTTYSALFAAIGTTFGAGDGWSTFNLPDLRGEFLRGWDDARGIDSGRAFGTLQTDDLKWHTHTASTDAYAHTHTWSGTTSSAGDHTHTLREDNDFYSSLKSTGSNTVAAGYNDAPVASTAAGAVNSSGAHTHTVSGTTSSDWHTHTVTVNATGGTETRPRNLALLFCIKY